MTASSGRTVVLLGGHSPFLLNLAECDAEIRRAVSWVARTKAGPHSKAMMIESVARRLNMR